MATTGRWLVTIRSRGPQIAHLALDAAGVVVVAIIFVTHHEADDLFHVVWVILTLEAFLYGLRGSIGRITAAAAAVVVYSIAVGIEAGDPWPAARDLVFSEWPLMLVIILLVAVMAERVLSTSRRYAALYREASDRLLDAQELERTRLAGQLHDGVGQTLTAVTLTLDTVTSVLATGDSAGPAEAATLVERARVLTSQALGDTRDLAGRLRPPRLHERGIASALEDLAANTGRPVTVSIADDARRPALLDADREVEAYRVVQEALANATRHAEASRILLDLAVHDEILTIIVADDGRGFAMDGRRDGTLGIPGMYERAAMMGARIRISSAPGAGTRVRLEIPIVPSTSLQATAAAPAAAALMAPRDHGLFS
jgi:signal transduction histidine kinase